MGKESKEERSNGSVYEKQSEVDKYYQQRKEKHRLFKKKKKDKMKDKYSKKTSSQQNFEVSEKSEKVTLTEEMIEECCQAQMEHEKDHNLQVAKQFLLDIGRKVSAIEVLKSLSSSNINSLLLRQEVQNKKAEKERIDKAYGELNGQCQQKLPFFQKKFSHKINSSPVKDALVELSEMNSYISFSKKEEERAQNLIENYELAKKMQLVSLTGNLTAEDRQRSLEELQITLEQWVCGRLKIQLFSGGQIMRAVRWHSRQLELQYQNVMKTLDPDRQQQAQKQHLCEKIFSKELFSQYFLNQIPTSQDLKNSQRTLQSKDQKNESCQDRNVARDIYVKNLSLEIQTLGLEFSQICSKSEDEN